jgi:hypothetical protein
MIEVGAAKSNAELALETAIVQVDTWKGRRLSYQHGVGRDQQHEFPGRGRGRCPSDIS